MNQKSNRDIWWKGVEKTNVPEKSPSAGAKGSVGASDTTLGLLGMADVDRMVSAVDNRLVS